MSEHSVKEVSQGCDELITVVVTLAGWVLARGLHEDVAGVSEVIRQSLHLAGDRHINNSRTGNAVIKVKQSFPGAPDLPF